MGIHTDMCINTQEPHHTNMHEHMNTHNTHKPTQNKGIVSCQRDIADKLKMRKFSQSITAVNEGTS